MMTDDAGNILWQDDVTPFGEETGESGFVERDGFYTGKKIDRDTDLYYFNRRWYDPTLGTFITEDPIKSGNNWYIYVNNNPLRYVDPTGLQAQPLPEPDSYAAIRETFYVVKEAVQSNPAVQTTLAAASAFIAKAAVILSPLTLQGSVVQPPLPPNYKFENGNIIAQNGAVVTFDEAWGNDGKEVTPEDILAEAEGVDPTKTSTVNGKTVYQNDDLIDPDAVDGKGRTNRERMAKGLAPVGPDGESVNLHHVDQTNDGPVKEMTATEHQENYKDLHSNTGQSESDIDRREFNYWRRSYWRTRSEDFEEDED